MLDFLVMQTIDGLLYGEQTKGTESKAQKQIPQRQSDECVMFIVLLGATEHGTLVLVKKGLYTGGYINLW